MDPSMSSDAELMYQSEDYTSNESDSYSSDLPESGDEAFEEDHDTPEIMHDATGNIVRITGELSLINNYFSMYPSQDAALRRPVRPSTRQYLQYNTGGVPYLLVNMAFKEKLHLQYCITHYTLVKKYRFKVKDSTPSLWVVYCCNRTRSGCRWYIRAIKGARDGIWRISKLDNIHTCPAGEVGEFHPNLSKNFIGNEMIRQAYERKGKLSAKDAQQHIYDKYHYRVPYKKALLGVQRAIEMVYGSWESSMVKLPTYLTALQNSNPGTPVEMDLFSTNKGHDHLMVGSIFWGIRQFIDIYRYCEPVICVDVTHLYNKYDHKLMVAVSKDLGGHLVPLAYGLVDGEDAESWKWFMQCVETHVVDHRETCIISDRAPGMLSAVRNMTAFVEGKMHHRFCLRHVISNFNKKFNNEEWKEIAYRVGSVSHRFQFNQEMGLLRSKSEAAYNWLNNDRNLEKKKWAMSFDDGKRCGNMTTNLVECMNNVLKGVRSLPITSIVEFTYIKSWEYFVRRRGEIINLLKNAPGTLSSDAMKMFKDQCEDALLHDLKFSDQFSERAIVVVQNPESGNTYNRYVDIQRQTCSCGKWTKNRIPCSHAIKAARSFNTADEDLLSTLLVRQDTVHTLQNAYHSTDFNFLPNDEDMYNPMWTLWHNPDMRKEARAGRQRNARILNEMDGVHRQRRGRDNEN